MEFIPSLREKTSGPSSMAGMIKPQSLTERLMEERDRLTLRLGELNKAIATLEKFPQVQEVMDIRSKLY